MSKHTPGPWSVSKSRRGIEIRNEGGLKTIATVTYPKSVGEWNSSPFHANACLIAAAPDLLAALNVMVNAVGNKPVTSVDQAEKIALAAIARATLPEPGGGK